MSVSVTNIHTIFAEAEGKPRYRLSSSLVTPGYVILTNHGAAGDGTALVVHPSDFTHVEFRLAIQLA